MLRQFRVQARTLETGTTYSAPGNFRPAQRSHWRLNREYGYDERRGWYASADRSERGSTATAGAGA
ncbi:hypothetical protein KCP69_18355 [Salmonella enterica subsp. enterica]|nr:hypothetical protein KCP69_18355 [Salmonella enterica subsp. enterica]